jgi:uncharacterized metal-binding protein YceD (DUF177 family)
MIAELHRPIAVARIGPAGLDVSVIANPAECQALARRMQVPGVLALNCEFHLSWDAAGNLSARGQLEAEVQRVCVVSLDEFTTVVREKFVVRCVPEGRPTDDDDPESPDEVAYADGHLDLGEAAAEQLALALDPYPRAPGAVLPEIEIEPDQGPFASLAGLRRKH